MSNRSSDFRVGHWASPGVGVHAVLFYGADGGRQASAAQDLAAAWLCQTPTDAGACGTCAACQAAGRGQNPDHLVIRPGAKSGLIALPSIVPVPPGRDSRLEEERLVPVREFLRTPPLRSRFKVVHVAEADRMNPRAANALLKTLEEPQPHGRLVFHTRSVGRVLPTILSRTLNVPAPLPPEDDLKRAFPEADAEDLDQSQGAPERLEEWMGLGDLRRELFGLFRRVAEMPPAEALHRAEDLRQAADAWSKIARIEPRQAQLRVLERLAWAFSRRAPARPEWVEPTLEIHRRLQQNGNAQVLIDALCAGLATGNLDRLRFR